MAKNKFSLNFDGFLDYAREIDQLGEGYLQKAVENAFTASKDYVNNEVEKAMNASRYNFTKGTGYSKGDIKLSFEEVKNLKVETVGTIFKAYIGIDMSKEAEEILYLIYGAPHTPADTKLRNAIKVKGKHKKEVEKIQLEEFNKVMEEALSNG